MNLTGLAVLICFLALGFVLVTSYGLDMTTWTEYDLLRVVILNETKGKVVDFDYKTKRFNKTVYTIYGEITFNSENITEYEIEMLYFYSSRGNNQYTMMPIKMSRKPLCDFLNVEYRKYCMEDFHGVSNLPYSTDKSEELCPQFKGTFKIDNYVISKETIPKSFDKGMYKGVLLIYNGEITSSGIEFYMKLY